MTIDSSIEEIRLLMEEAAKSKAEAEKCHKLSKRMFSQMVISFRAAKCGLGESEHKARASEQYMETEDREIAAATAANIKQAELDARKLRWETWRSMNANKRAEMKL